MKLAHAPGTILALAATFTLLAACKPRPAPPSADVIAKGKELVTLGGCGHCHTPMYPDPKTGTPLPDPQRRLSGHPASAGDPEGTPGKQDQAVIGSTFTAFRAPFGIVYAANLTPDDDTGLGQWTEADFIATMRTGHRKGTGRLLLPPMPVENLQSLPDGDLRAIYSYLRTLPPVRNVVPAPKVAPEVIQAMEENAKRTAKVEH